MCFFHVSGLAGLEIDLRQVRRKVVMLAMALTFGGVVLPEAEAGAAEIRTANVPLAMTVGCDKSARRANQFRFSEIVSSPETKNISVYQKGKSGAYVWPSRPTQRASAVVTDVGRVAVDADVLATNGTEAYGEVVWS
ncbi:hypothetical protein [Bradyrhizobium sp. AUGA SZCCT0431]|uniref:hypothetical protein n=1 Tax=Bradyrhizobium sp. AUGA SZCCT0431 TaxID=2807674 RepID=UPI001BAA339D|nr:hypothetical protein [Bradyrhizobium sp. AUGA SZCCT0431]MBR1143677.1 hypothetical protein [Bradyrhizobium sp. AUGA SZCCT0431]